MNNSVRAYEEKKAEQACFSTYAKEPQTMASPNQTVISATTCTLQ